MKKHLQLFAILFLIILWAFATEAFAQEMKITGKVKDATDGSSLPGVSILIKNTTRGTTTDIDGSYSITAGATSTLVFSFVGYTPQEVVVGAQKVINIFLKPSVTGLEEIVVIGYGQVKKSDATGSLSVLGSKDFNRGAISNPMELLVGKAAGVIINTNNGAPGANSTIRIRGGSSLKASNDPLIVIDGVPFNDANISGVSNSLNFINPNDIESFTVLKDASATAIYGSRASNGVILITTKKGKVGAKMRVSYNGILSFGTVQKDVDVLTGDEYRALAHEKLGSNNINETALASLGTANTDWQKEIYRTAVSHDHNISVGGAVKSVPYRVSLGYTDQEGILKNTSMKRNTLSFNLDPTFLNGDLKVNVGGKGMYTKQDFSNDGAVGAAILFDPTQPVMNGNSRYGGYFTWTTTGSGYAGPNAEYNQMATSNPVAMLDLTDNKSDVYRGNGNIQFDYKVPFIPDLHANLNMAIDAYKSDGHNNVDTIAVWTRREGFGRLNDYNQEGNSKTLDFLLNYKKDLDALQSKVEAMAGYSYQRFWRKKYNYQHSIVDLKHPHIVADSMTFETENVLVSFFGRINYSLMDKYLLTVTLRDDGSSRFAPENRWGLFPSLALAWKIKNEDFLKDVKAVTDLKLRLGWGVTGQQNIITDDNNKLLDYPYMGTYTSSVESACYQIGYETVDGVIDYTKPIFVTTLRPNAYDPSIKWESTTTQNIGLDFSFYNDRISGSLDYYKRETKDLINSIPIPNGSNFSNYLTTNVGSLENKGFEISLNLKPIAKRDMTWDVGFNFTYNENKITKFLRTDDPTYNGIPAGNINGATGNNILIQSVDYPTYSFFVLQQVYDVNGFPIEGLYVDLSGEGGNISSNLANFYHYKKPVPDYLIGLSSRFSYKKFDIGFSARINLNNYVYNNVASQTFYGNMYNNNYWQNLSSQIKDTKFNNAQYFSDIYIENASYFKMDNISAGYNFTKIITEKLRGRVSFTVQNAFTITKYKGIDPEVNNGSDKLGIDNNFYPRARVYMLGVNLDL